MKAGAGACLEVARNLRAAPERAWGLLTDTSRWPLWGPSVRGVLSTDRYIRKGSRGRVLTPAGIELPFLVTAYEELRFWGWEVAGISATGHRLIPVGADGCRLVFELPNLLWWPYAIVCKRALANIAALLE